MGQRINHQISGDVHLQEIVGFETDEVLAARAATDPAALSTLYERYLPSIFQYCRYRLRDENQAEDVTAQIFLKMVEGLGRSEIKRLRPWLFTVAHHEVVSTYRKQRPVIALDALETAVSRERSPEDEAVLAGDIALLRTMIARLAPVERDVIELRLAGLSATEISLVLGKSYSGVSSVQHRAYTRLRELMNVPAAGRSAK